MLMSEAIRSVTYSRRSALRGEMCVNEPMRKHTSWRAGGEAVRFYKPADSNDLAVFLKDLPSDDPVIMIGLGSNLLVRDGGFLGTVISLHARLSDLQLIQQDKQGSLIYIGAGVACAKVARFAARHDLAGAEFLAGIPGTFGGALAMNAGCYGSEIWQIVTQVQVINRMAQQYDRLPEDYQISYRQVRLQPSLASSSEEWFMGGWLRLRRGSYAVSHQQIKDLLMARINSQPLNLPNAGSVFRNPPGDYAARLIESCQLKRLRIGGAMISSKHANFIVNTGNATAADIEGLITIIKNTVKETTGISLELEVKIIGDFRDD